MWIRDIQVLTGGKEFTNDNINGFFIDFEIPFSDSKEPDIAEVNLYNLSNNTISSIESDGYIYVNAGYKNLNNRGNILTGKIEDISSEIVGLDKITKILASDGGKAWRDVTVNKTYKEDTKASYIMRDLATLMGYEIADINPVKDLNYKLGKTITGKANKALEQLVKDTSSKMYINKNRLFIRNENKGTEIGFILNKDSGLVGSPEKIIEEENGKKVVKYKISMLLNPLIATDSLIQVESSNIKGKFRVLEGKHTLDFNTEIIVKEGKEG